VVPSLGVKGPSPTVSTRGRHEPLYVFAVTKKVTESHSNTSKNTARARQPNGLSTTRRIKETFAARLSHIARQFPAERTSEWC
jgi:hypothetical protein